MNNLIKLLAISAAILSAMLFSSCEDDFKPGNGAGIPDGEGDISAIVDYMPLAESLTESRSATPGDALKDLSDLFVLVYDRSGSIFRTYSRDNTTTEWHVTEWNDDSENRRPIDAGNNQLAESSTKCATFKIPSLPFGDYYIYVVSNMGPDFLTRYKEEIKRTDTLLGIKLKWDSDIISNNGQMLGYITTAEGKDKAPRLGASFEAPLFSFRQNGQKSHAWLRRAASKVTVTFDGKKLRNNVTIYFKNVRIHDIPTQCYLGKTNTPQTSVETELQHTGSDAYIFSESDNYSEWPSIQRGRPTLTKEQYPALAEIGGLGHSETDKALYFFENAQGNKEGNPDYDKRQEPEFDADGRPTGNVKDFTDLKDKMEYGTYIEVEGYYVSRNPDNVTNGKIIYRFMLGQDTKFDYNAFRNCHYKLTLTFNGNANDYDWHIDYHEDVPQFYMPEKYYISYLYDRVMYMPLRVNSGKSYKFIELKSEIISNNWAPEYDDNPQHATSYGKPGDHYTFTYDKPWYLNESATKDVLHPLLEDEEPNKLEPSRHNKDLWAGFLSLMRTKDKEVCGNSTNPQDLIDYWNGNGTDSEGNPVAPRGYRTYYNTEDPSKVKNDTVHGHFNVVKTDTTYNFAIPMYTRAKNLSTHLVYTGNNPYPYRRTAVVRFTAKFQDLRNPSEYVYRHKRVVIEQVPRIVNPKGIWRPYNSDAKFDVELLVGDPIGSNFNSFNSDGPWRAEVAVESEPGWILLNGKANNTIHGDTGTPITFEYKPKDKLNSSSKVRHGVIRVYYNNYTCVHLIFVRQGYADQKIVNGGATWSTFNLYDKKNLVTSPLSPGSFFKHGNKDQAILELNNNDIPEFTSIGSQNFFIKHELNNGNMSISGSIPWTTVKAKNDPSTAINTDNAWGNMTLGGRTYQVASYRDAERLMQECQHGFGVLYGEGASAPATSYQKAYGYTNWYNYTVRNGVDYTVSDHGMRGMFVYNPNDGRQLFFPLGATGHGRRQDYWSWNRTGSLRYGDVATALTDNRVMVRDLCQTPGALYWYRNPIKNGFNIGEVHDSYAMDINYYMFAFTHFNEHVLASKDLSDALFIRCVRNGTSQ